MSRSDRLLAKDRSVLVLVDMQEVFLKPMEGERSVGMPTPTMLEGNIRLLLQVARLLAVPVIPTLQHGARLGGVIPTLAKWLPEGVEPIDKLCFSCYGAEAFARQLQATGRSQVLLVGIETHICVLQTAFDLLAAGYQVHVPWDATASRTENDWRYALDRMRGAGVMITGTESALYEWLFEAGTGEFKQILPLLKEREAWRAKY